MLPGFDKAGDPIPTLALRTQFWSFFCSSPPSRSIVNKSSLLTLEVDRGMCVPWIWRNLIGRHEDIRIDRSNVTWSKLSAGQWVPRCSVASATVVRLCIFIVIGSKQKGGHCLRNSEVVTIWAWIWQLWIIEVISKLVVVLINKEGVLERLSVLWEPLVLDTLFSARSKHWIYIHHH